MEWPPKCDWQDEFDAEPCGAPADVFRKSFIPDTPPVYYCPEHIKAWRRKCSDEKARYYGVETYTVDASSAA